MFHLRLQVAQSVRVICDPEKLIPEAAGFARMGEGAAQLAGCAYASAGTIIPANGFK
jgi:hypothetical protein